MSRMAEMGLDIAELIQTLIVAERDMINVMVSHDDIALKMERYNNAFRRAETAKRKLHELGIPYGA